MKTVVKTKLDFERRSQYQDLYNYSRRERNFKEFEDDQFIVPWQMEKKKKDKLLME